jgi:hypothetical protein
MDLCQVGKLIYELSRVNIKMLSPALLANQTFSAFRIAAHVLALLLMDLALRVYR